VINKSLWAFDELEIFELFNYKCANCRKSAVVLHEIVFKSLSQNWKEPGNRIPLCAECHEKAHGNNAQEYKVKFTEIMEKKIAKHQD